MHSRVRRIPSKTIRGIFDLEAPVRLGYQELVLPNELPVVLFVCARLARDDQMLAVLVLGETDLVVGGTSDLGTIGVVGILSIQGRAGLGLRLSIYPVNVVFELTLVL